MGFDVATHMTALPVHPQGVLLPALGTFHVGEALEDRYATYKRYRPTFGLLEGRFGGVSQERGRYRLMSEWHCGCTTPCAWCSGCSFAGPLFQKHTLQRANPWHPPPLPPALPGLPGGFPVVQINYGVMARDAGMHRSVAQRLLLEMLQRIAMHIVTGHGLRVDFPGVGLLIKNRWAGAADGGGGGA